MLGTEIVSAKTPSFKMVVKYFVTAIFSFLLLNFLLMINYTSIAGYFFQPRILALVHIGTLGWITMIIFGALFQLVPVVLEVKLFSETLGEIQYWIFTIGIIGLVTAFWNFDIRLHLLISAIMIVIAMIIFIVNLTITMFNVKKWNITGAYLIAALFYLLSTAAAGLLMAINLGYPYIHGNHIQYLRLHADVALIGWVLMVIMGVSYKLIPMFTLSHGYSMKPAWVTFFLINTGLLGITTVMHYQHLNSLYFTFLLLIIAGVLTYLFEIYLILKARVRKKIDIGIKHSIAAFAFLFVATILGLLLTFVDFKNQGVTFSLILVYGYTVIFGFISMLIIGQLYKILPFLVWFHKYSSKVGTEPVPLLKDMFYEKVANTEFIIMIIAITGALIGLGINVSGIVLISFSLMFLASLLFTFNMITIFKK